MIFDQKPDFINELGTKFWKDKHTERYAKLKDLKNIISFYVECSDGTKTILLCENNEPIYENTALDAIGCWIDVLAFIRKEK